MMDEENKLLITEEMVEAIANMFKSNSKEDGDFAWGILKTRDKNNVESETNFNKIAKFLVKDEDKLFPTGKRIIIKVNNKILTLSDKYTVFKDVKVAIAALSRHLSKYLGTSLPNTYHHWKVREYIYYKSTCPTKNVFPYKNTYNPYHESQRSESYDPNFGEKEIKEYRKQQREKAKEEAKKTLPHSTKDNP